MNETAKFFASGRLETAVAYRCNPSVNTMVAAAKTRPGSVPSNGEPFLLVVFLIFLNCKTTIHEDPGSIPCSGELFGF